MHIAKENAVSNNEYIYFFHSQ